MNNKAEYEKMILVETNTFRFIAEREKIFGNIIDISTCSFVPIQWPRQKNGNCFVTITVMYKLQ